VETILAPLSTEGSLYLKWSAIDRIEGQADAEWAGYEFVRLISAALRLVGVGVFLEFQSIESQTDVFAMNLGIRRSGRAELSLPRP